MIQRGHSLVEMLVVMSLLGSLGGLVATSLATAVGIDNAARRDFAAAQSLGMCELQLRADTHRARDATIDDSTLTLMTANETKFVWRQNGKYLEREAWRGKDRTHSERWQLPHTFTVQWERDENWLTLRLSPQPVAGEHAPGLSLQSLEILLRLQRLNDATAAPEESP